MGKTRRRGGGILDTLKGALGFKSKEEKCAAKKADYDKECGPGEASASDTSSAASGSAEMSGAPPTSEPPKLGARRRRSTRRKYKGGKHRKGHRA